MLISNVWKCSRNLPNVVRHNQYLFDNTKLTSDNVVNTMKERSGKWNRYELYEEQQVYLTHGIISALQTVKPSITSLLPSSISLSTVGTKYNKDNTIDGKLYDDTVDMICTINDNMMFTNATTSADIGQLAQKYKLISYEWYLCLAHNGSPFGYGDFNYNKYSLPKNVQDAKKVLEKHGYRIDYDPNGIGMKLSFRGFHDNPYVDKNGNIHYCANLNIDKYDRRNSVPLLYKLGQYATLKILMSNKNKADDQMYNNANIVTGMLLALS